MEQRGKDATTPRLWTNALGSVRRSPVLGLAANPGALLHWYNYEVIMWKGKIYIGPRWGLVTAISILILAGIAAAFIARGGRLFYVRLPVVNASFELPKHPFSKECLDARGNPVPRTLCSYSVGPGSVTGWEVFGAETGVFHPDKLRFNFPLPDGEQTAASNAGSLSQVLTATLEPSSTYLFYVSIGRRKDNDFTSYSVEVSAGSAQLVYVDSTKPPPSVPTPAPGAFVTLKMKFASGAAGTVGTGIGQPLKIKLTVWGGPQVNFDNVQLFKRVI